MTQIKIYKDRNNNHYVEAGEYKVRIADGTRHDGTTIGDFELIDNHRIMSDENFDIQKEVFIGIDCVEPNSETQLEYTSFPISPGGVKKEVTREFLELYRGEEMIRVFKEDVEKLMHYFNNKV